jgi:hypothetical protein
MLNQLVRILFVKIEFFGNRIFDFCLAPQEVKLDRWIEIASPYINYPSPSALNMYVDNFVWVFFC